MASWHERYKSRRTSWMEQTTHKLKNEDLLTYYLSHQDAKKSSPSANQQSNIFTLPCSDSMRRDIQILQQFIKKREPCGAVVTKEEVVIASEDTEVCKQTSPRNNNLTEAASLMQEQQRQAASRERSGSRSVNIRVPPGDRLMSQSSARTAELEHSGHLAEDFRKRVYWFAAVCLLVAVGFLCWTRLRQQLGNYYWLSLTLVMSVATIILSSIARQIISVDALRTLIVTAIGSITLGIISDSYDTVTIMQVGGITAFATLLLFLFALKTNKSLTNMTISTTTSILGTAGAIICVLRNSYKFQAIYALLGTLLFATDLTRTVVELERQPTEMQCSMDYAEAAQGLFISVAMIFFFTLLLVG